MNVQRKAWNQPADARPWILGPFVGPATGYPVIAPNPASLFDESCSVHYLNPPPTVSVRLGLEF